MYTYWGAAPPESCPEPDEGVSKDVDPVVSRRLAKVTDLVASYGPVLNMNKSLQV